MRCRCRETTHFHGAAAQEYSRGHLTELKVDDANWIVLFQCPETGIYWKEHFPRSGEHGGGASELLQIRREEAATEFGLQLE